MFINVRACVLNHNIQYSVRRHKLELHWPIIDYGIQNWKIYQHLLCVPTATPCFMRSNWIKSAISFGCSLSSCTKWMSQLKRTGYLWICSSTFAFRPMNAQFHEGNLIFFHCVQLPHMHKCEQMAQVYNTPLRWSHANIWSTWYE